LAVEIRRHLGVDETRPVDDICDAVESLGVKVYLFESMLEKVFGFSIAEADGGPAIGVNVRSDISVERRIFTAAHELGHLVLHRNSYEGEELEENLNHEKEANVFASHFLMPSEAFAQAWEETKGLFFVERVMKTKRYFLVSYLTVLKRLVDMGIVDSSIWPRFKSAYEKRYGKKLHSKAEPFPAAEEVFAGKESKGGEPSPLADEDFVEDRLNWLVRTAVENEHISVSRGAEILRITASEMRELMESWELAA
jgi:Zn-dependent peptidase ImmA (M78 family)